MNKYLKLFAVLFLLAVLFGSCAKTVSENLNVPAKRALDAWLSVHDLGQTVKTGHGIYITYDEQGTGDAVKDSQFVFLDFRYSVLEDSTIAGYSDEALAKQLGAYSKGNFYGASAFHMVISDIPTGIIDLIHGSGEKDPESPRWDVMRIGGTRSGIIPGWLTGTGYNYETEQEYMDNVSGSNYFYTIKVTAVTDDIEVWQQDTIQKFMAKTGKIVEDTTSLGIWYYRDKAREIERGVEVLDSVDLHKDTTIYINYIGRLLNGNVFDTNISEVAKQYGIYSSSSSYEPVEVTCSTDSTSIQMNSSSVISGFGYMIWAMHPFESGRGIFPARLGYGASGSMPKIPSYAPLIFDIDIVEEPE